MLILKEIAVVLGVVGVVAAAILISHLAPISKPILFSQPLPRGLVLTGAGDAESWGRWSIRPELSLALMVPRLGTYQIDFAWQAFGPNALEPTQVRCGDSLHSIVIGAAPRQTRLSCVFSSYLATIAVTPPRPVAPTDLGVPGDTRPLGVGLISMTLTPPT